MACLNTPAIPPLRLHAPGSNEDAVSHDHNPDANEAVLAGASANAETFALPEGIQGVIGELMLRSDTCTRLADQLFQSEACPFSFLLHQPHVCNMKYYG